MSNKNRQIVENILPLIGGTENVALAGHCMTRLRLNLKDYSKVDVEQLKKVSGVVGCVNTGAQLQIIIGTNVGDVYDEFCEATNLAKSEAIEENLDEDMSGKKELDGKTIISNIFAYLSGSLTPLIPVLIVCSLCKTIVAVLGPQLLGVLPETSDLYILFTFLGDAGFYFLPIILAGFAAKKMNVNQAIAVLLAAVMIHPTFMNMATEGTTFTVYGFPCAVQNYSFTVIPVLLVVWVMGYVEKFFKKISPDVLKVVLIPFGTFLVMVPVALCILGPAGSFIGNYICNGIIWLYDVAGPLAVAIIGALFGLLVCTGMHQVLFVYLFTMFPMLGYDAFMLPGILACSWAGTGVALACIVKFKSKENKSTVISYALTWFFGGVGEPMLYGLNLRYKTTLYASILAGAISGFAAGVLQLKAYVLNTSNGMYGLLAFLGGPTWNYVALAITLIISLASGFVIMMFMPLNEEA